MQHDVMKRVLEEAFPEECQSIGPDLLDKLVSNKIALSVPSQGQPFGNTELEILNHALGILESLVTIFAVLAELYSRSPTAQEIDDEANSRGIDVQRFTEQERSVLIKGVVAAGQNDQKLSNRDQTVEKSDTRDPSGNGKG